MKDFEGQEDKLKKIQRQYQNDPDDRLTNQPHSTSILQIVEQLVNNQIAELNFPFDEIYPKREPTPRERLQIIYTMEKYYNLLTDKMQSDPNTVSSSLQKNQPWQSNSPNKYLAVNLPNGILTLDLETAEESKRKLQIHYQRTAPDKPETMAVIDYATISLFLYIIKKVNLS